jgi:hypothetical protein
LNGRVRIALLGSAAKRLQGRRWDGAPGGRGIVMAGPGAASAASNWREVKSISEKVRREPRLLLPCAIIRPMVARARAIEHPRVLDIAAGTRTSGLMDAGSFPCIL